MFVVAEAEGAAPDVETELKREEVEVGRAEERLARGGGIEGGIEAPILVIQGCRIAGSGLSRRSGSHVRHLAIKSMKSSSSVLRT